MGQGKCLLLNFGAHDIHEVQIGLPVIGLITHKKIETGVSIGSFQLYIEKRQILALKSGEEKPGNPVQHGFSSSTFKNPAEGAAVHRCL